MSITDFNQKTFMKSIRAFMKKNRVSFRQFEKLSGVNSVTFYRAEQGKTELKLSTIAALEKAMQTYKPIALFVVLLLANCAAMGEVQICQDQAGPKPYAAADLLGLPGVLVVNQNDERKAWYKRVDDCMATWRAANP